MPLAVLLNGFGFLLPTASSPIMQQQQQQNEEFSSKAASYINLMLSPWRDLRSSWVVQSESNVRRERRKVADPPCVICKGGGRVTCRRCKGRGRTNFTELAMLPKGEWPVWCGDCKGSGLDFCDRCLGTGERRGAIGFHINQEDSIHDTKSEAPS